MAAPAPAPNTPPLEGNRDPQDEAKDLIEKCLQLYMNREEIARVLETEFGIEGWLTRLVWSKLERDNPQFFQDYYTRLVAIQQINRFNELLEKQFQAMNLLGMPVKQQISMELTQSAPQADSPVSVKSYENGAVKQQISMELTQSTPQADSPVSVKNYENGAVKQQISMESTQSAPQAHSLVSVKNYENETQSDNEPANPVGSVGSEEVTGSDPNLIPCGNLVRSSLKGQGMRINADTAHMPISQVPNHITGGQLSSSAAQSLSQSGSNTEGSDQKDYATSASGEGSTSAYPE